MTLAELADADRDFTASELAAKPADVLIAMVLQYQQDRWLERVGSRGTMRALGEMQASLVEALAATELANREIARLREEIRDLREMGGPATEKMRLVLAE